MGKRNDIPDEVLLLMSLFCQIWIYNALVQLQIIHRYISKIFQRWVPRTKIIQAERYAGVLQFLQQLLSHMIIIKEHAFCKFQLNQWWRNVVLFHQPQQIIHITGISQLTTGIIDGHRIQRLPSFPPPDNLFDNQPCGNPPNSPDKSFFLGYRNKQSRRNLFLFQSNQRLCTGNNPLLYINLRLIYHVESIIFHRIKEKISNPVIPMYIFLHSFFIHTDRVAACLFCCVNGHYRILYQPAERWFSIRYRNPNSEIRNKWFYLIPRKSVFCLHKLFQWNWLITGGHHFTYQCISCSKFPVIYNQKEFIPAVPGYKSIHGILLTDVPDATGDNL